jgi:hypothetical protein
LLHLQALYDKLPKQQLYVDLQKSVSFQHKLVYLGLVIFKNGLELNLAIVKAIMEWPTSSNTIEGQYFHGLENFSKIATPMISPMKGNKNLLWTKVAKEGFQTLKRCVVEALVLALLYFN